MGQALCVTPARFCFCFVVAVVFVVVVVVVVVTWAAPSFRAHGQRMTATHWRSLCQPAMLPLTTHFFPTPAQLNQGFSVNMYDVVLPLEHELKQLGYDNQQQLVKEMVAQRLAQVGWCPSLCCCEYCWQQAVSRVFVLRGSLVSHRISNSSCSTKLGQKSELLQHVTGSHCSR